MIGEILYIISLFLAGFITGVLVGRNNVKLVEKSVTEALELYEKAEQELKELKAAKSNKKPRVTRKVTRKKPVKKPQVD